jgi:purine-binding chemotaxis protein CheW
MPGQILREEMEAEEVEQDQYLVFKILSQEFGIQAMWVQEISRPLEITLVPNSLPYIEGVTNLRGKLATVINFRKKFAFDEKEHDEDTRFIIIEHLGFPIGIIVDSVEEVIRIGDDLVQKLSESTSSMTEDEYITGVGMLDKRMIIILDVEKVLEKIEVIEPEALKQAIDVASGLVANGSIANEPAANVSKRVNSKRAGSKR